MADHTEAQLSRALSDHLNSVCKRMHDELASQMLIAAWPRGFERPNVAAFGNETGFAAMARAVCETAVASPRPDNCAKCAAAWDAMKLAAACLADVEAGQCH